MSNFSEDTVPETAAVQVVFLHTMVANDTDSDYNPESKTSVVSSFFNRKEQSSSHTLFKR